MLKEGLQNVMIVTTMCAAGLGVLEGSEKLMPDVFDPVWKNDSFKEAFIKRAKKTVVILGAVSISLIVGFGTVIVTDKLLGLEYEDDPDFDEE